MKYLIINIIIGFLFISPLRSQSLTEGNQFLYYERYNSAEKSFQELLQTDPNNIQAWWGLVRTYLAQDKVAEARHAIDTIPSSLSDQPLYKIALGAVLLAENNKADALAHFNQVVDDARKRDVHIFTAVAQANIESKNGDHQLAIKLLQRAMKRDKRNAELYIQLGDAYRRLLNGAETYKAYQKAIDLNSKYAAAYHRMGELFVTQNNPGFYVEYFKKAIAADPHYAPSLYELYYYEFNRHPDKALEYYKAYVENSDWSVRNEYELADLYYINNMHDDALQKANDIIKLQGNDIIPRLYKLISYSYAEKNDTAQALDYMQRYFAKENDSNLIAKDFLSMGDFMVTMNDDDSLAMGYIEKGVALEKDSTALFTYYKKLADVAKQREDFDQQAKWLGRYYNGNNDANNLDLFNWGVAYYRADNYLMADSVFQIYAKKYPEQSFGYYWIAKAKALQDTSMEKGLAVPAYEELIEILEKDTTKSNHKKWLVEAYGYLAAYEANTEEDFGQAVVYFDKVLALDPENSDAKKYKSVLEKAINNKEDLE
jgi:tetratricopeptide (TPR) repeat protein